MGFFSPKIDNVELAYQLFATLGVGGKELPQYKKAVDKMLEKISDRQEILLKVIELAGPPDTPKQRYILARAYSWSRAQYRKEAIRHIELYLNNELYIEYRSPHRVTQEEYDSAIAQIEKQQKAAMLIDLAKAYDGEHEFGIALDLYRKVIEIDSKFYGLNLSIAALYRKMNNLDMAIYTLEQAKKNPLLKPHRVISELGKRETLFTEDYSKMFDRDLEDLKNKKAKGYIYKQRKKD